MNNDAAITAIQTHKLHVFPPKLGQWTVRKEDANGNTVAQAHDSNLLIAINVCVKSIPDKFKEETPND